MKVLVVYEMVPEETKFYIVEADAVDLEWMKATHGYFVNQADIPPAIAKALDKMSAFLETVESLSAELPITLNGVDLLIHTGFLL